MKKLIRLATTVLGAFALAFLLTTAALPDSTEPEDCMYIMRDYNGRVAVFRSGESAPQEVFEVFTSSLPPAEYERLLNGITVRSDSELQELIEAYTG